MIFKVYQNYISRQFLLTFVKTVFVFITLAFILNIFEEINFFKDLDVSMGLPIFLTFLKSEYIMIPYSWVMYNKVYKKSYLWSGSTKLSILM